MDRLIKKELLVIALLLAFGCTDTISSKEQKAFYQAYEGSDYIYAIEAEFLHARTFFSIYTKGQKKVFEKKIDIAPVIDSVNGKNIYLLRYTYVSVDDKRVVLPIYKTDTTDIGFENYKFITRYTCVDAGGRGETKYWKFSHRVGNMAYFTDIETQKEYAISTNKIVSKMDMLSIREKKGRSESFSDITFTRNFSFDSSNATPYFNSFFEKR
jgi:hypothetical protein